MSIAEIEKPITTPEERFTGPIARTDGSFPGALDMVHGLNEVFNTGEEGEVSFVRGMLRCLGHCAIGTPESELPDDTDVPPVNPWKLLSSLSKAAVSGKERREMIGRIKEGMSIGDSMGMLAVLGIYDAGRHSGLSKEQARSNAWDWYGRLPATSGQRASESNT